MVVSSTQKTESPRIISGQNAALYDNGPLTTITTYGAAARTGQVERKNSGKDRRNQPKSQRKYNGSPGDCKRLFR
jgi:hypothetical protein